MTEDTTKPGLKPCTKCKVVKSLSEYRFRKDRKIYESRCMVCSNEDRASRHVRVADLTPEQIDSRRLEAREYYAKYIIEHRGKKSEQGRRTYLRNKDAINQRARAWAKRNKPKEAARMARRRARTNTGNDHTGEDIKALLKAQKGLCIACKCDITNAYTVDHVIPLAGGGGNDKSNIQLLCKPCNSRKSTKDPIRFMQEVGYLL